MAFDDDDHGYDGLFSNNENNSYSFNSKIMIAAIVSLIVVVLLIIILHIYGRCVLRRRAQRRAMAIHHLTVAVAAQAHSSDQPKKGLDPAVISSFISFPFKKNDQSDTVSAMECAVCLSVLEEGEMIRNLPNCNHSFHTDCIDAWLISHTNCPVCRTEAEPRVEAVPAEPTAPPAAGSSCGEGSSDCGGGALHKAKPETSPSSRLSSFRIRRMLTGERSSSRIQPSAPDEDNTNSPDIERQ